MCLFVGLSRLSAAKSESVKAAEKHDRLANDLDSAVKLLGCVCVCRPVPPVHLTILCGVVAPLRPPPCMCRELPSSSPSYAKQFDRVQALRADIPASEQHLLDAIRLLGDVQASHDAEELRLAEEYRRCVCFPSRPSVFVCGVVQYQRVRAGRTRSDWFR